MTSAPIYAVDDLLYFDIASNALTWVHGDGFAHTLRTPATTAPTAGVEDPTYRPGARNYAVCASLARWSVAHAAVFRVELDGRCNWAVRLPVRCASSLRLCGLTRVGSASQAAITITPRQTRAISGALARSAP